MQIIVTSLTSISPPHLSIHPFSSKDVILLGNYVSQECRIFAPILTPGCNILHPPPIRALHSVFLCTQADDPSSSCRTVSTRGLVLFGQPLGPPADPTPRPVNPVSGRQHRTWQPAQLTPTGLVKYCLVRLEARRRRQGLGVS